MWTRLTHSPTIFAALAIALYVVLAYIYALIKPMWCDEVWAIVPAYNLLHHGFLGMGDIKLPTVYPLVHGNESQFIFWYPPLSYFSMTGWFALFGHGLIAARLHTIMWGVILLCGIYRFARSNYWVRAWVVLIIALDYNFLVVSDARPDIMCAALGIWAIVTGSAWFAVAAFLVHPFGIMYVIALACIKRRIEWLPYLAAILILGIYASQNPALWLQQNLGVIYGHFRQTAINADIGFGVYLGFGTGWRLVLLATYVVCASMIALRHRSIALCLGLIAMPAWFLTNTTYYFPHAVPWLALCVALQMRRWPWLGLITIPQLVWAINSLPTYWNF